MALRPILALAALCLSLLGFSEAGLRHEFIDTSRDVTRDEAVQLEETDETTLRLDDADQRRLATAKSVGNNGSPSSAFPLGLCEGDCDSNNECEGDLICRQRNPGDGVPSYCSASSTFKSSTTDICVKSSSGSSSGGSSSSGSSSGGSSSGGSILRLYWQQGYMWQEDPTEKKWCLRCQGSGCNAGDQMIIVNCVTDSPTRIQFVNYGDEFMMKPSGTNLCFDLDFDTWNYYLRSCNSGKSTQRFTSGNGSRSGSGRFEMYPKSKSGFCLTQRHHPKWGEALRAETCSSARNYDTSYWIKF